MNFLQSTYTFWGRVSHKLRLLAKKDVAAIMKYTVRVWAMGPYPEVDIDKEKFDELKKARNCLSGALAIEEKYELLLSNYVDLEKECLDASTDYMVRNTAGYGGFFDIRLAFNRRIVNLLTSTKLYIDQIQQHVKACVCNENDIENKIKSFFSTEYDNNFEYRFMEALRNYVQHRGLAVHSTTTGGKLMSHEEREGIEFKTSLFTHKSEVEGDKAFKKQVSNEMPEKVNLIYAARVYVGSISKAHCEIRGLLKSESEKSRNIILNTIKGYEKINNGKSIGLSAICSIPKEPIDETVERIPLLLDWDDIRINLIKKNTKMDNLGKRYVSGAAYNR